MFAGLVGDMNSLQQAPLFKISLACGAGIFLADKMSSALLWLLPLSALALLYLVVKEKRLPILSTERLAMLCILLGMIGLGALRHQASLGPTRTGLPLETYNCQPVILLGQVVAPIKSTPWGRKAQVKAIAVRQDSQWQAVAGKVMLYLDAAQAPQLMQYDTLCFAGSLRTLYSRYPGYLTYLQNRGVEHSARAERVQVGGGPVTLQALAYRWQQRAVHSLRRVIDDAAVQGLAEAMFLGEKRGLTQQQREAFAAAGASHVLAISGLHVGLIFALLNWLLTQLLRLPQGRRWRAGLILVVLLTYLFLTGAAPAVSRATLMLSLVLVLRMCFQRFDRLNLVAAAAMIQMMISPTVIFEIGFQLSYAAVLGIVLMLPCFERCFEARAGILMKLYAVIGVSLVATLATAPLVIVYFGQFPTYFLLTNLLISLFVSALVMLGFLTVVLSACPLLGELLGACCTRLLRLLDVICQGIADLPHAVIDAFSWREQGLALLALQLLLALIVLTAPRWLAWYRARGYGLRLTLPHFHINPSTSPR
jgi:competence protein ComEC